MKAAAARSVRLICTAGAHTAHGWLGLRPSSCDAEFPSCPLPAASVTVLTRLLELHSKLKHSTMHSTHTGTAEQELEAAGRAYAEGCKSRCARQPVCHPPSRTGAGCTELDIATSAGPVAPVSCLPAAMPAAQRTTQKAVPSPEKQRRSRLLSLSLSLSPSLPPSLSLSLGLSLSLWVSLTLSGLSLLQLQSATRAGMGHNTCRQDREST